MGSGDNSKDAQAKQRCQGGYEEMMTRRDTGRVVMVKRTHRGHQSGAVKERRKEENVDEKNGNIFFALFNLNKLLKKKFGNQNIPPIKSQNFDQTDQPESENFFPCILSNLKRKYLAKCKNKIFRLLIGQFGSRDQNPGT